MDRARRLAADALGLGAILLVLLDLLRPSLLFLPTLTAGGDTPCHYPTAVWFHERLLPQLRLHGWYPGASLGHPLLLYYFPLPFVLMSALAPLTGMPVAFKLGTALGVFLLPLLAYASLRLMRLPFPAPLVGAAASLVFLYLEDNPIWGGTIASTLTGEFSYTYGVGLAVLFLGVLFRARADGRGPWAPAAVLALTCYAHGYAVLWAGLTASGLLLWDPRPGGGPGRATWRTLGWLAAVAALAFALAGPALVPLLADWGWTTPYDDAWIAITTRGLLPALLWPLFLAAAVALGVPLARRPRRLPDERLLLLAFGALSGAALAVGGPGPRGRGRALRAPRAALARPRRRGRPRPRPRPPGPRRRGGPRPRPGRRGLRRLALGVLRHWVDWNYSGLEAKELWPAWQELNARLRGGPSDPRVAFEYSPVHERAGSLRMHEMVPFFSGRSGIEGVYSQSSTTTHPVYYLLSELLPSSSNPFRSRSYSRFDLPSGLARLRLFGVGQIVATSPALVEALDARPEVVREARIPPYTLFRLADPGPGTVEPLAFAPVRASPRAWRDQAYRWVSRKPPNRAVLVFTEDPRFDVVAADPWAPPPERPLPGGVEATAEVGAEEIRITTSRPGHPLLVKVSYHPRWKAEGASGPYLASPGLMLIVPSQREVRLTYAARAWSDHVGLALGLGGVVLLLGGTVARRRGAAAFPRAGLPRAVSWPCRSRSSWRSPRCASFRGPRTPPRRTASTSGPRGPTPPSAGRRPPSTPATPSRPCPPGTPAGPRCCASGARRSSGPGMPGKRSRRSHSWWRTGGDTSPRPCTREPGPGRRRATPRGRPRGEAGSGTSSPRPRGPVRSRDRGHDPGGAGATLGRRPGRGAERGPAPSLGPAEGRV